MTYTIVWEPGPVNAASGYLRSDPDGLRKVFATVDKLAHDPRPAGTTEFGSPDRRRLRVGTYSLVYEVHDDIVTILVLYLGRQ